MHGDATTNFWRPPSRQTWRVMFQPHASMRAAGDRQLADNGLLQAKMHRMLQLPYSSDTTLNGLAIESN